MASYLATAEIGKFVIHAYRQAGIRYWDAIDPDLLAPVATPRTGTQFAISQQADLSYKRLARTITVPAGGANVSFWVTATLSPWDFMFVEAHTPGRTTGRPSRTSTATAARTPVRRARSGSSSTRS